MRISVVFVTSLIASLITCSTVLASDWAQLRGPYFNGSTDETGLPARWSQTENIAWSIDLPGPSAATPIVSGDHVFVSSTDQKNDALLAMAFDRKSGKELWRKSISQPTRKDTRSTFSSPTPATDGDTVVFFFGNGEMRAYDFAGEERWRKNLGPFAFGWTFSTSPLIYDGTLYMQILQNKSQNTPSYILAMNPTSGKELWRHERPSQAVAESLEAFTTPMPYEHDGVKQLLVNGDCFVLSKSRRFLSRVEPKTGKIKWETALKNRQLLESSPLAADGKIYVFDVDGVVSVVDAASGKILSTIPMEDKANLGSELVRSSIIAAGGNLFIRTNTKLFCVGEGCGLASEPKGLIRLNDDGAWCWYQDERALIHQGQLLVGSVACGVRDDTRRGDIELTLFDLESKKIERIELHDHLQADDHNVPGLLLRPDGSVLAIYSKHGPENQFYYRISHSDDLTKWESVREFVPSKTSRVTYSNVHFLQDENDGKGRIYNFFRGLNGTNKPSYAFSNDLGQTWMTGNIVIEFPTSFKHRPYVKYASDGKNTIHLLYTDAHPRNFNNNIYHVYYRDGLLYRSDGSEIRSLKEGLDNPGEGTLIFRGNSNNIGWTSDLHLSCDGRPYAVCTVRKNSEGQSTSQLGNDLRYRYAWWDGKTWHDQEIAYAGTRLYPNEYDYTGNICLDPDELNHVYISTNADPGTGEPLISEADGRRHYEIFHGVTDDGGDRFSWEAITKNSSVDNLRPMVPKWNKKQTLLLWYRGVYRTYVDYETEVVAVMF